MARWLSLKPIVMTSKAEVWLDRNAENHQNRINKLMRWLCVPMIVLSLVDVLWAIPVLAPLANTSSILNLGTAFLASSLIYYRCARFAFFGGTSHQGFVIRSDMS